MNAYRYIHFRLLQFAMGGAVLLSAFFLSCGQMGTIDAGVDAAMDAISDGSSDSSDSGAIDAQMCLARGQPCTSPSVCCRTVCDFLIGDEFGKCQ